MSKLLAKTLVWTKAGVAYSTPRLANFWRLAKVELRPPTPSEVGVAIKDAQKGINNLTTGKFQDLEVKKAWQNVLVATEVICWFFVGEVIGRRSLIGYNV